MGAPMGTPGQDQLIPAATDHEDPSPKNPATAYATPENLLASPKGAT